MHEYIAKFNSTFSHTWKISLRLVIAITFILLVGPTGKVPQVYSDGLTEQTFPAQQVAGKNASLFVSSYPPLIWLGQEEDVHLTMAVFNESSSTGIRNVTASLSIWRSHDANSEEKLFSEKFFIPGGSLVLIIQRGYDGELEIVGARERDLSSNALLLGLENKVSVKGRLFSEGGLYHFQVRVLNIETARPYSTENTPAVFDFWINVVDITTQQIVIDNQLRNVTMISHYDKIMDFNFDAQTKTISWSIPFNLTRIVGNYYSYIHQEVRIPRIQEWNTTSFYGTADNQPLSGRNLIVDPYSSKSEITLHYLVDYYDILRIANATTDKGTLLGSLRFTLSPYHVTREIDSNVLDTDIPGLQTTVRWQPETLVANATSVMDVVFHDGLQSGQFYDFDVHYDMVILDSNGNTVFYKEGLIAKNGMDRQQLLFPRDDNYELQIIVNSVSYPDRGLVDENRVGMARGYVVVPELQFGHTILFLGLSTVIVLSIYFRLKQKMNFLL